jgi:hypothetical protein
VQHRQQNSIDSGNTCLQAIRGWNANVVFMSHFTIHYSNDLSVWRMK